jgi:microcystin-dependent protein
VSYDWARNSFTGIYYPYTRVDEEKTVAYFPHKGAWGIQLDFSPLITTPVSFSIYDVTDARMLDEVPHGMDPGSGNFRVDYEAIGQDGSGFVEANSSEDGNLWRVNYKHSGRILTAAGLLAAINDVYGATISALQAASAATAPVGSIMAWTDSTPPANYLECNGAAISRATYSALFTKLGTRFGSGDGSTTFNLPDLRGEFLRGWDHGRGVDPDAASRTNRGDGTTGDNVGTKQGHQIVSHEHSLPREAGDGLDTVFAGKQNAVYTYINTTSVGGNETRPRNVGLMFCVRYV